MIVLMRRKIKIILIVLTILVVGVIYIDSKLDLYVNWKIYLPSIQRRTAVLDYLFQDEDQIFIFKYHSKDKMKMIRDINHFSKVSPENIEDIRENY